MPTNTLYKPPTVDNAVYQAFGMQPNMDRLNLLPRYDKKVGWVAPNALYQLARAFMTPSVGFRGGEVTPEDALNFGMSVMGTSAGVSRAVPKAVPKGPAAGMATVYHGSPHNFDAFDATKIGTGEGAQAYGHGLYVADSPDVAKSYSSLGHVRGQVSTIKGRDITSVYDDLNNAASRMPHAQAQANYDKMALLENLMNNQTPSEVLNYAKANGYSPETVSWFEKQVVPNYKGSGNLYTADLPDSAIANMLDWDKPLSQQPEAVKAALKRRITEPKAIDGMDMGGNARLRDNRMRQADPSEVQPWVLETNSGNGVSRFGLSQKDVDRLIGGQDISQLTGGQIYQRLVAEHGGFPQASSKLKELGIPGIRYLDGGSRSKGAGTSNYVVFDDKLLKILKKE